MSNLIRTSHRLYDNPNVAISRECSDEEKTKLARAFAITQIAMAYLPESLTNVSAKADILNQRHKGASVDIGIDQNSDTQSDLVVNHIREIKGNLGIGFDLYDAQMQLEHPSATDIKNFINKHTSEYTPAQKEAIKTDATNVINYFKSKDYQKVEQFSDPAIDKISDRLQQIHNDSFISKLSKSSIGLDEQGLESYFRLTKEMNEQPEFRFTRVNNPQLMVSMYQPLDDSLKQKLAELQNSKLDRNSSTSFHRPFLVAMMKSGQFEQDDIRQLSDQVAKGLTNAYQLTQRDKTLLKMPFMESENEENSIKGLSSPEQIREAAKQQLAQLSALVKLGGTQGAYALQTERLKLSAHNDYQNAPKATGLVCAFLEQQKSGYDYLKGSSIEKALMDINTFVDKFPSHDLETIDHTLLQYEALEKGIFNDYQKYLSRENDIDNLKQVITDINQTPILKMVGEQVRKPLNLFENFTKHVPEDLELLKFDENRDVRFTVSDSVRNKYNKMLAEEQVRQRSEGISITDSFKPT